MLPRNRHRERNAKRIADPLGQKFLEGRSGFQNSLGRHARFGHAQVQRHVGTRGGKTAIDFHDFRRIGILQRNAIPRETQPVEPLAMLQRAFEHRTERVAGREFFLLSRIDRAAIHADPQGAIVLAGDIDQKPHLLPPRFFAFVMIEMPGIVADFIDPGSDLGGQPVVFLQIDGKIRPRFAGGFP